MEEMDNWLEIRPVDGWMFRDGRPFNQSDSGAAEARSVFPPWPPTVVGAIRAAVWKGALQNAWDPARLGDGTDWQEEGVLGPLRFGPLLVLRNDRPESTDADKARPVFPMPLHIMYKDEGTSVTLTSVAPGPAQSCDLGGGAQAEQGVRLPRIRHPVEGAKTLEGHFVTARGMRAILRGGLPRGIEDIVPLQELIGREPRVGIAINPETRRVHDGALYMATYVRPAEGVSLALACQGLERDLGPRGLAALGGEHRMAEITPRAPVSLPAPVAPEGGRRLVVAITPVVLDRLPAPGEALGNLGTVVSACLGRVVRIGGWDSLNRRALPLKLAVPAGSVWFLENAPEDGGEYPPGAEGQAGTQAMPATIGEATEWGFGAVLLGKWEEQSW